MSKTPAEKEGVRENMISLSLNVRNREGNMKRQKSERISNL